MNQLYSILSNVEGAQRLTKSKPVKQSLSSLYAQIQAVAVTVDTMPEGDAGSQEVTPATCPHPKKARVLIDADGNEIDRAVLGEPLRWRCEQCGHIQIEED